MNKQSTKQVRIDIPTSIYTVLQVVAHNNYINVTVKNLIQQIIIDFIEEEERKGRI